MRKLKTELIEDQAITSGKIKQQTIKDEDVYWMYADKSILNEISGLSADNVQQALSQLQINKAEKIGQDDIEITDNTKGLILSDGVNRWRVTVNSAGDLITTLL